MTAVASPTADSPRVLAFDAVKGVLVMLMIGYHALSIASTGGEEVFRFIRFISGSFIFITGFIVSAFMLPRFLQGQAALSRRLYLRGIKIIALFTALNVAIAATGLGNLGKRHLGVADYIFNAATIYLSGDSRTTSFAILLPIGYLLVLAPAVLAVFARASVAAPLALLALSLTLAAIPGVPDHSLVIEFMLLGLTGMALGAPTLSTRLLVFSPPGPWAIALCLAVALWLAGTFGGQAVLYTIGIAAIVKLLLDGARLLSQASVVVRVTVLLGQYSLFAYIAQIASIQLLFRASSAHRWPVGPETLMLGIGAAAMTIGLCVALHKWRLSSRVVDASYRAVFS
jgi:uncharacterized membrane protein YidH (DUF202 family)